MCGICGKFALSPDHFPTNAELDAMCRVITHRGPDSQHIYVDRAVGLGARRLSIIDLVTGDQPLSNEDGTIWAALNGEVYNFQVLRADLLHKGHVFSTETDTEVLVHLYEEYGDDFVTRCEGMFAFSIYDAPRQRMLLARDRIGKKPLFYYLNHQFFVFGSELKCLFVNDAVPREAFQPALLHYLMFGFVAAPQTAFRGVFQLEPAHYMVIEGGRARQERYWNPAALFVQPVRRSFAEAREEYLDLLRTSITDRLISDVPVGLLLSGGIDSTSIAAIMAEQNIAIPTFTIRFRDGDKDEGETARRVAERIASEHEELYVEAGDFWELLPRLVWHYEQPFGDLSAIPSYYVAQMARQRVTVVLNGDGGDENFGGYWRHLMNALTPRTRWLPAPAWKLAEAANNLLPRSSHTQRLQRWAGWFAHANQRSPYDAGLYWLAVLWDQVQPLLARPAQALVASGAARRAWDEVEGAPYLNRVLYSLDLMFHLPDMLLVKMDRATMANSLEARSPFLDHRMFEFAASLPPEWKVHNLTTKWFPKRAMASYLPLDILHKKKTGFGIPLREWLSGPTAAHAWNIVLSESASRRGLFDMERLRALWQQSEVGHVDAAYTLYRLLFLELWYRAWIDECLLIPDATIMER